MIVGLSVAVLAGTALAGTMFKKAIWARASAARSKNSEDNKKRQQQVERVALTGEWHGDGPRSQGLRFVFTPGGHLLVDDGTRLGAVRYQVMTADSQGNAVVQLENDAGSAELKIWVEEGGGHYFLIQGAPRTIQDLFGIPVLAKLSRYSRVKLQMAADRSGSDEPQPEPDWAKLGFELATLRNTQAAMETQLVALQTDRQRLRQRLEDVDRRTFDDPEQGQLQRRILLRELAEVAQQIRGARKLIQANETQLAQLESPLRRGCRCILLALGNRQQPDPDQLRSIIEAAEKPGEDFPQESPREPFLKSPSQLEKVPPAYIAEMSQGWKQLRSEKTSWRISRPAR